MAVMRDVVPVGTVQIQCPACPAVVPVPVTAHFTPGDETESGRAELVCTPDMTDMWAHVWQHEGP